MSAGKRARLVAIVRAEHEARLALMVGGRVCKTVDGLVGLTEAHARAEAARMCAAFGLGDWALWAEIEAEGRAAPSTVPGES